MLKLQKQLSEKAVENVRLYIVLLVVVLVFIVLWAYQVKRSQMHFKKRSQHDDLTGVFNRLHFVELAESALLQAQRNKQELCIAVFDLDHFKAINDNHGHSQGDATLQRVVEACQRSMRDTDVLARIGGEEFALLMTNCGLHEACARAERLRAAIADSKSSDDDVRVSASFGIACTSISGSDFRWLMHDADRALYEAKNAGRNRIAAHWTARESEDRSDESSSKPRESDAPIGTPRPI